MTNIKYYVYIAAPFNRKRAYRAQLRDIHTFLQTSAAGKLDLMFHWTNTQFGGVCDSAPICHSPDDCDKWTLADLEQENFGKLFAGDPWYIGTTYIFTDADTAMLFKLSFGGAA